MVAADADGLYLDFQTRLGTFSCRLDPLRAPRAVACVAGLAEGVLPWVDPAGGRVRTEPFFDGSRVHRVVGGQWIEAGLRAGIERSGPGYRVWDDAPAGPLPDGPWLVLKGRGEGADGACIAIVLVNQPGQMEDAVVLGSLVAGRDVVESISRVPAVGGAPVQELSLEHVGLRRVGAEAESYDPRRQRLPLPSSAALGVAWDQGRVVLSYSTRPFLAGTLWESGDLRTWTSRDLGLELTAENARSLTKQPAGGARFFKLVQVAYPPDGYAPASLAGGVLVFSFADGEGVTFEFDSDGTGRYSSVTRGAGVIDAYNYRQDIQCAWLEIGSAGALPGLRLRLDFGRDDGGAFKGFVDEGGGRETGGTFAMTGLKRPLVMVDPGPVVAAWVGHTYRRELLAAGGKRPWTWSLVGGKVPEGLSMDTNGVIAGTPTAPMDATFQVAVTDGAGRSITNSMNIPVLAVDPRLLEAYWALDGDWSEAMGRHPVTPIGAGRFVPTPEVRGNGNGSYGTGLSPTNNGAVAPQWTRMPETEGMSMEGWVWLEDDTSIGTVFGFGDTGWDLPKFNVGIGYGFIWATMGRGMDGATLRYPRIGDTCWHHMAMVLPKGFRGGEPFRFYLDGAQVTALETNYSATGEARLGPDVSLLGQAFTLGRFRPYTSDGVEFRHMRMDEVRVWARELSASEVATLATPTGVGDLCLNHPAPNWAPGPRFVAPAQEPTPAVDLGIHGFTDDALCIVTDPNPWLKARIVSDCGLFLRAMETNRSRLEAWFCDRNYEYAASEVISHYRPGILAALSEVGHFTISGPDLPPTVLAGGSLWPQGTREFRVPNLGSAGGEVHAYASENVYFSFFKLPTHLKPGGTYRVTDAWGNSVDWTYDEDRTTSWALKVNQVGYMPDAPKKYAYMGMWTGPGGALDLARFDGQPFELCRESDSVPVFRGTIAFRRDDSQPVYDRGTPFVMSGEKVYELDFSAFATPGRYYIRVPGAGRSWSFEVGQDALGESFYVSARGLFHQRCEGLSTNDTPWARGDEHQRVYRAAFPTQFGDYDDHSAEGWGFLDASGNHAHAGWVADEYSAITATKTTELVPGLHGGWHDAGDFDQPNESHLYGVRDLVVAYLMFPENFTDGQLSIPESGNGIPDILDEAVWGVEVCRRSQDERGAVPLWINTDGIKAIDESGSAFVPYYLGIASRSSTLMYAEYAALLSRGLRRAGATDLAQLYLDSALRAYAFAASSFEQHPRVSVSMVLHDRPVTWTESVTLDPESRLRALIQLWLASGDPAFYDALNTPVMAETFRAFVLFLYWRTKPFELMDVVLEPSKFPAGWGDRARGELLRDADDWVRWMDADAYRKLWYAPGEGYFIFNGWGHAGYDHVRNQVAAWRITGDAKYRTAALLAVDWMQGANPQGRSYTTGLGQNYVVHPLHLPSDGDGIADPVPGLTIYGPSLGVCWGARYWIYGLFEGRDPGLDFNGTAMAQLPPPWNNAELTVDQVGKILSDTIPVWRTLINLEGTNPGQMEFTVSDTVSQAAAVTGCLMGPGWSPSQALKSRRPRSAAELRDAVWFQP